jgi:hypothetical protein
VPKITKMDAFSLFQARPPISKMKEPHPHQLKVKRRREWCCSRLQSPRPLAFQTNKTQRNATNTHTQTSKIRSAQYIQILNFRFKSCKNNHRVILNFAKVGDAFMMPKLSQLCRRKEEKMAVLPNVSTDKAKYRQQPPYVNYWSVLL